MKLFKKILFTCAFAILAQSSAFSVEWRTNFDQAVKQAKSEQKPILLVFTGSDWCIWCKKLESEVLDTPEFDSLTRGKFIFVLCDFPKRGKQSPELAMQNKELKTRFNARGFPTVLVLDENSKIIGKTGYQKGGPVSYVNHLESFLK